MELDVIRRKKCPVQYCENKANREYWIEFTIEDWVGHIQMNVCFECYYKISQGQSYSL